MAERELLIEVLEFAPGELTIVESETPGGPLILRGVFQRSDTKNSNNRIYPRALWERVLRDGDCQRHAGTSFDAGNCSGVLPLR